MFQTVGHNLINAMAECMQLPLYRRRILGSSLQTTMQYFSPKDSICNKSSSITSCTDPIAASTQNEGKETVFKAPPGGDEVEDLFELLRDVLRHHPDVQAVSCGAIFSTYQRVRVENVCARLGLTCLAYLWQRPQQELLAEMIAAGVEAVLVKVAVMGLDGRHLGRSLGQLQMHLLTLAAKYNMNVCGEGGEYETFTLDCPLYRAGRIEIDEMDRRGDPESAGSIAPVVYMHPTRFRIVPKQGVASTLSTASSSSSFSSPSSPLSPSSSSSSSNGFPSITASVLKDTLMALRLPISLSSPTLESSSNSSFVLLKPILAAEQNALASLFQSLPTSSSASTSTAAAASESTVASTSASPPVNLAACVSSCEDRGLGGGLLRIIVEAPVFDSPSTTSSTPTSTSTSTPSSPASVTTEAVASAASSALQLLKTSLPTPASELVYVDLSIPRMAAFADVNKVYREHISLHRAPSRACVQPARTRTMISRPSVAPLFPSVVVEALCTSSENPSSSLSLTRLHVQSISEWAPASIGPYAQAVAVNGVIFMAGQIGLNPATMTLAPSPQVQFQQMIRNCAATLSVEHADVAKGVVACTVYVHRAVLQMEGFAAFVTAAMQPYCVGLASLPLKSGGNGPECATDVLKQFAQLVRSSMEAPYATVKKSKRVLKREEQQRKRQERQQQKVKERELEKNKRQVEEEEDVDSWGYDNLEEEAKALDALSAAEHNVGEGVKESGKGDVTNEDDDDDDDSDDEEDYDEDGDDDDGDTGFVFNAIGRLVPKSAAADEDEDDNGEGCQYGSKSSLTSACPIAIEVVEDLPRSALFEVQVVAVDKTHVSKGQSASVVLVELFPERCFAVVARMVYQQSGLASVCVYAYALSATAPSSSTKQLTQSAEKKDEALCPASISLRDVVKQSVATGKRLALSTGLAWEVMTLEERDRETDARSSSVAQSRVVIADIALLPDLSDPTLQLPACTVAHSSPSMAFAGAEGLKVVDKWMEEPNNSAQSRMIVIRMGNADRDEAAAVFGLPSSSFSSSSSSSSSSEKSGQPVCILSYSFLMLSMSGCQLIHAQELDAS